VKMPLGSPRFGMVEDRFGVLWIVILPAWRPRAIVFLPHEIACHNSKGDALCSRSL
jgi:hypothetical protein